LTFQLQEAAAECCNAPWASKEYGLSQGEAQARLLTYGKNTLPEEKTKTTFQIFLSQFFSPLILILILAAATVFFMGETVDGLIIVFVLLFNATIGTFQEGKAQNTLKALKNFIEGNATVVRDGVVLIISDKEVVPGDILILQEGEKVPADARIIASNYLKIDEASLTGESVPIVKIPNELLQKEIPISDQKNMVFAGSLVVDGNASALVVRTGESTEIARIARLVAKATR